MDLKTLLSRLRAGEAIVLKWSQRFGPEDMLEFRDGLWIARERTCFTDTCNCHNTYDEWEITRERALVRLREYIAECNADDSRRDAEISWLDNAIADVTALVA